MASVKASAILPKRYTDPARGRKSIDTLLLNVKEEATKMLQTYPTWRPWKNPPRTGIRAGGKRTGSLGRGWGTYTLESGKGIEMTNQTEYASFVQGNSKTQQARALAARGWTTVDVVGPKALKQGIARSKLDA